ncbi:hypothetical protein BZG36_02602 [Bifiguratus adelaidae]|uniref:Cwf19-like C-terminal domain-containing protein n=1 Tax=Bifiguratus adelaidae TaxID=1938954 RepID=A0A261Y2N3_9FUNG|nr:hypothetical protein BZG36_02602 [Bifiguratus adelaidae]
MGESTDSRHHKKHKHDKHKKHKKSSSSKHRHSDDAGDVQVTDDMWVEKPSVSAAYDPTPPGSAGSTPSVTSAQRPAWMLGSDDGSDPFALFGVDRKKQEIKEKRHPDKVYVSERELNPYIKQGVALDDIPDHKTTTRNWQVGDAGSNWRMTKLRRVQEQAREEGRSVEEVGRERYGSLEKLQEALDERAELDRRRERRDGPRDDGRRRPRMMFTEAGGSRDSFKRPDDSRQSRHRDSDTDEFGRTKRPRTEASSSESVASYSDHLQPVSNPSKQPSVHIIHPDESLRTTAPPPSNVLSRNELNKLNAKIVKARLMDAPNLAELEAQYEAEKQKHDKAVAAGIDPDGHGTHGPSNEVIIPTIDSEGKLQDFALGMPGTASAPLRPGQRKKKEKFDTHDAVTGERVRYSAYDDKLSLQDLVRQEKFGTKDSTDMDLDFARRIATDATFEADVDYLDENAERMGARKEKSEEAKMRSAIQDHKRNQRILENCGYCYHDNIPPRVPMIALGTKTYLAIPEYANDTITPFHAYITPLQHVHTTLLCDDDTWDEIRNFMKCLMRMADAIPTPHGMLFWEQSLNPKGAKRHAYIEAVPIPLHILDQATGYFKEALYNAEPEQEFLSSHAKIIDTRSRKGGFRSGLVPQMAFFHVWFGLDGGFGHIIEDERAWPRYFGRQVIEGMLDAEGASEDHGLMASSGRKRREGRESEGDRQERIKRFADQWKPYDWTVMLEGGEFNG